MITKLGEKATHLFLKYMPNAFVFAILLTLVTGFGALIWLEVTPLKIIESWYNGFFDLLGFAMQIVLIIITGFSIALSPIIKKGIDKLAIKINSPTQVYITVLILGGLLCLISFGWAIITAVFARELAKRVRGINYPYLVACVYVSLGSWVLGLSSSIPLLLNTKNNYLLEANVLSELIPTSYTLGSTLNMAMILFCLIIIPLVMWLLIPKKKGQKELGDLLLSNKEYNEVTIKEEANNLKLPFRSVSDFLNNNMLIQMIIVIMGLTFIIQHFYTRGFDLNFNIMIFIFIIVGLALHKTPMRYVIAMKRSSTNISGILFQYPFYAGIMGIMLYTGLGNELGELMASAATMETYPFFAYLTGSVVNFAIPSAGGEFAVVGPSIINAVKEIGAGLPSEEITAMISRASLSVAYGESLSNLMQPFYLLLIMPVMGAETNLQARDIMGYLLIPFILFFMMQVIMITWLPI